MCNTPDKSMSHPTSDRHAAKNRSQAPVSKPRLFRDRFRTAIRVIGVILSLGAFLVGLLALRRGVSPTNEVGAIPAIVLGALGLYISFFVPKAVDRPPGRSDASKRRRKRDAVSPSD
jgi:hypothetical protein